MPHYFHDPRTAMRVTGCMAMLLIFFFACLLPWLFVEFAQRALQNLHLHPAAALAVLLGSLIGSAINIPVAQYPMDREVEVPLFDSIGGFFEFRGIRRLRQVMTVSVNVGGCIIPVLLAIWLLPYVVDAGGSVVMLTLVGMALNSAICYRLARLIPGMGIALFPGFLPALVGLGVAWAGLGDPGFAGVRAPVAFIVGISGPLIGADLLHWKDFQKLQAPNISIGGAGTWDGIVLSGLLAAFLAGAGD